MTEAKRDSRLPGFFRLESDERRAALAARCGLSAEEVSTLKTAGSLPEDIRDQWVENVVGSLELPMGIGVNLRVNDRDVIVPMAVEEPSVIAAVSNAAKVLRDGNMVASADASIMVAQIQVVDCDVERARRSVEAAEQPLLTLADECHPSLVARGGGARDVRVRTLRDDKGAFLVVEVAIDVCDAMGANLVNTVAERLAEPIAELTAGRVVLRILSNLCDRRRARASFVLPVEALREEGLAGMQVAEGIVEAQRFAEADPYRAATHNKGIMNGIDAVALATGNDWRAIEAGAHAFAARTGQYGPLTRYSIEAGHLLGSIELPLAVGIVGGITKVHPVVRVSYRMLGVQKASELAGIMAAVGLAQNFAALRALSSVGIQRGHMAQHARAVAIGAGAVGAEVARVVRELTRAGTIREDAAVRVLQRLRA